MRNNKILMAAIAAVLTANCGVLYATTDEQLENVTEDATRASIKASATGDSLFDASSNRSLRRPNAAFDFTGGQTVLSTAKDGTSGIIFASEIFGSAVTLPAPATSPQTADYMGVVYTIDGTVPVDFDATFTLDNGATFAEAPILGVRDKKATGIASVSTTAPTVAAITGGTQSTQTMTLTSDLSTDTVFRFAGHETLYVASPGGTTVTAGSPVTFYQLGDPARGLTPTKTVAASEQIYGHQTYTLPVRTSAVDTISAFMPSGASTMTVGVSSNPLLIAGQYYTCGTQGSNGGTKLFSVQSVSATTVTIAAAPSAFTASSSDTLASNTVTTAGSVSKTVEKVWSTGALLTTDCAASNSLYRVHVPGDTLIFLEPGTNNYNKDNIYQFDAGMSFPQVSQYKVTGTSSLTATIAGQASKDHPTVTLQNLTGGTGLANALQGGEVAYHVQISLSDDWTTSSSVLSPKPPMIASGAAGKNVASFSMNASKAKLESDDQLMLLYKLSNVGVLADPGQKINMTVDMNTGGAVNTLVNPKRTVTVAQSAKALTVSLSSLDAGKLNIAVSTGNTQFSGEVSQTASVLYGYVNNTTAAIGQLKIQSPSSDVPYTADGQNEFAFVPSTTLKTASLLADNSTLIISGGQFSASKTIPGTVRLNVKTASTGASVQTIAADEISQDASGMWNATWKLDTTELKSIAASGNVATIEIGVDGKTEVNPVENSPLADLIIDFNVASYQDVKMLGTELRRITKDGNVCTVYNVPPPSNNAYGADIINIRVTNDSTMAGKLTGKLYNMDGGEPIWTGDLTTEELKPGVTVRISNDQLAKLTGVTWEGRAVLKISSTIPQMEVMALIRQNGVPFAPLSNLSTGARGTSCSQD